MVSSIKRTLSIESLFPAFKAHCPDLESSYDNFLVDDEPAEPAAEISNPFAAAQKVNVSPRWPLEQPEIPLTFSVLNAKHTQPVVDEAVTPVPVLEPAETLGDESCDEYFNYDSLPSSPTSPTIEKRSLYFPRPMQPTWADNVKLNRKRVQAAWGLMGSVQNREAYYEQVMLASQSLNPTSLFSGLARQTMAPAL